MQFVISEFDAEFLRGLSHRMNNILSLFQGYLELLTMGKELDAKTRNGLAKIQDGAKAATDLMSRVQAISRPMPSELREVDVPALLQQLRPTFEANGKKVEIEYADGTPPVWGDSARVRMALTELGKNACEAASSRVRIQVSGSPSNGVNVQITDDGPGIPAELSERIYHPFYTTKKALNASGLGLTIAMVCTLQLKGSLAHRSKPGETTFELTLPAASAQ